MPRVSSRGMRARIPAAVWLVTLVWASLLLGASLLWKMSYGYDEPLHVDMAYVYSKAPFTFYGPGELSPTRTDATLETEVPGYQIDHNWPQAPAAPVGPVRDRSDRPTLDEAGGTGPASGERRNQMVQHPPLPYWLDAVVLRLPGVAGLAWDVQVWLLRLLSVALALPLPILCWATARRLLGSDREVGRPSRGPIPDGAPAGLRAAASPQSWAVLAALVPLSVPGLVRNLSSVSNDVLLVLATSVFVYAASRVVTGDLTRRTSLVVSVSLAIALLSKGFALVLPLVAVVAYGYAVSRGRPGVLESLRRLVRPAIVVGAGAVVGGLWWLRNLLLYGAVQINGIGPAATATLYGPPDGGGTLAGFLPSFVVQVLSRIWGGVGLPDDPVPGPVVVWGWLAATSVGLLAALVLPTRAATRTRVVVLTLPAVLTMAVVCAGSFADYRTWSAYLHGAQGRYLYLAIVPFAACVTLGWRRLLAVPEGGRAGGRLPVIGERGLARALAVVAFAALATNAAVWAMIISTWYTTGPTLSWTTIRAGVAAFLTWAPVPPVVVVALTMVVPTGVGVVGVVGLLRTRLAPVEGHDRLRP